MIFSVVACPARNVLAPGPAVQVARMRTSLRQSYARAAMSARGRRSSRRAFIPRASGGADDDIEADLKISGMKCDGCVSSVKAVLQANTMLTNEVLKCFYFKIGNLFVQSPSQRRQSVKGVTSVAVDLDTGVATLGLKADGMVRAKDKCRATDSIGSEMKTVPLSQLEALNLLPACVEAVRVRACRFAVISP